MSLDGDLALNLCFQSLSHGLIELDQNLNRELGAESAVLNHLVQRLRQAHSDRRPAVQFERRHCSLRNAMNRVATLES